MFRRTLEASLSGGTIMPSPAQQASYINESTWIIYFATYIVLLLSCLTGTQSVAISQVAIRWTAPETRGVNLTYYSKESFLGFPFTSLISNSHQVITLKTLMCISDAKLCFSYVHLFLPFSIVHYYCLFSLLHTWSTTSYSKQSTKCK